MASFLSYCLLLQRYNIGYIKKVSLRKFSIQFKQKKFIVNYKYTDKRSDILFLSLKMSLHEFAKYGRERCLSQRCRFSLSIAFYGLISQDRSFGMGVKRVCMPWKANIGSPAWLYRTLALPGGRSETPSFFLCLTNPPWSISVTQWRYAAIHG